MTQQEGDKVPTELWAATRALRQVTLPWNTAVGAWAGPHALLDTDRAGAWRPADSAHSDGAQGLGTSERAAVGCSE